MVQLKERQLSLDDIEAVYRIVCRKVEEGCLDEMEYSALCRSTQEILSLPNCPKPIINHLRRLTLPKPKDLDSELLSEVEELETDSQPDQSNVPTLILPTQSTAKPKALFFRQVKISEYLSLEEGGDIYQKISATTILNGQRKATPKPNDVVYCYGKS